MFDISWSELLILGVVTLIFVGPKELPVFLRTIGRYMGMVRRQANEFRAHFDEAMREAELDALKQDMQNLGRSMTDPMRDLENSLPASLSLPTESDPSAVAPRPAAQPKAHNENTPPATTPVPTPEAHAGAPAHAVPSGDKAGL